MIAVCIPINSTVLDDYLLKVISWWSSSHRSHTNRLSGYLSMVMPTSPNTNAMMPPSFSANERFFLDNDRILCWIFVMINIFH